MTNDGSLLAHLSSRLTNRTEDIAVEALGYILSTSEAARTGLLSILRPAGTTMEGISRVGTQVAGDEGDRPDLVCWDENGDERLLIEAKFWAGLTDKQPNAYLERLPSGGTLLFVAPEARLDTLWRELERLAKEGDLEWTADADGPRSANVGGKRLILTAWRTLLEEARHSAEDDGDTAAVASIRQLNGLCEREDEAAFVPLRREELGPEVPRRLVHLNRIIDRVVDKAEADGLVRTKGLGKKLARDGYGRWFALGVRKGGSWVNSRPAGACLCLHYTAWSKYRETPIWLELADKEKGWRVLRLKKVRKRLRDDIVVGPDGTDFVPIYLPTGVELDQVVDAIVDQLSELAHRIAGVTPA